MDHPGVEMGGDGPHDRIMEARVTRLEDDMRDVRVILARLEPVILRIDAAIPHLATRVELEAVRSELTAARSELRMEVSELRTEVRQGLASKPGFIGMWMMAATLITLVVAALGAGAVYMPLIFRLMHTPPP